MDKIAFIQNFIEQCDVISEEQDSTKAKKISELIVGIFQNEIKNIHYGLDNYSGFSMDEYSTPDYLSDINRLKMKLLNYVYDLKRSDEITESELEKLRLQSKVSAVINNTNSNVNENHTSINVSISAHVSNCIQLIQEDKHMSTAETQMLQELLINFQLEVTKGKKEKSKDKLKSIVATLMDKGMDTLISLLPSIGSLSAILAKM